MPLPGRYAMKKRAKNGVSETNAERLVSAGLGDIRMMMGISLRADSRVKLNRLAAKMGMGTGEVLERLIADVRETP
jgi:hypothetical protein